jgi:hypothetical protein
MIPVPPAGKDSMDDARCVAAPTGSYSYIAYSDSRDNRKKLLPCAKSYISGESWHALPV